MPAGVFAPAGQNALAEKMTAANSHHADTPERRRKTTDPERWRPGASVFVSRLNFPEATGGVVFIFALAFLEKALVTVRAVWQLAPSPVADFFVLSRSPDGFFQAVRIRSPGGKFRLNSAA